MCSKGKLSSNALLFEDHLPSSNPPVWSKSITCCFNSKTSWTVSHPRRRSVYRALAASGYLFPSSITNCWITRLAKKGLKLIPKQTIVNWYTWERFRRVFPLVYQLTVLVILFYPNHPKHLPMSQVNTILYCLNYKIISIYFIVVVSFLQTFE